MIHACFKELTVKVFVIWHITYSNGGTWSTVNVHLIAILEWISLAYLFKKKHPCGKMSDLAIASDAYKVWGEKNICVIRRSIRKKHLLIWRGDGGGRLHRRRRKDFICCREDPPNPVFEQNVRIPAPAAHLRHMSTGRHGLRCVFIFKRISFFTRRPYFKQCLLLSLEISKLDKKDGGVVTADVIEPYADKNK